MPSWLRTDLARIAADLLENAADSGLPVPDMARLSTGGQEVSFGFPGRKETFRTLAQWAERFGGTVTGEPYTRDDGEESVYCQFHGGPRGWRARPTGLVALGGE